jgi:hypothetical protein
MSDKFALSDMIRKALEAHAKRRKIKP